MSGTRSRRRAGKVNAAILAVGLAITVPFVALMALSFGRDPRAVPSMMVDRPAPAFALTDLDGTAWDTASLRGRTVVVNFWSTWCVPCKQEHPVLQAAARTWPEVVFLGVLFSDEPAKARTYLKRAGSAFPTLIDPGGVVGISYGVAGVPETFFIDPDGTIRHKQVGPVWWELMQQQLGAP